MIDEIYFKGNVIDVFLVTSWDYLFNIINVQINVATRLSQWKLTEYFPPLWKILSVCDSYMHYKWFSIQRFIKLIGWYDEIPHVESLLKYKRISTCNDCFISGNAILLGIADRQLIMSGKQQTSKWQTRRTKMNVIPSNRWSCLL